jgi:hypothetical protein
MYGVSLRSLETRVWHFHAFLTSFPADHMEKWPWGTNIAHVIDMAGKMFDMPFVPLERVSCC